MYLIIKIELQSEDEPETFQDTIAALVPTVGGVTIIQHYYHHKHQLALLNGSEEGPAHTHTPTHTNNHTRTWIDSMGRLIGFNGKRPQSNSRADG